MGLMLILLFRSRHELQRYGQFPGSGASGIICTQIDRCFGQLRRIQIMFSVHVGVSCSLSCMFGRILIVL